MANTHHFGDVLMDDYPLPVFLLGAETATIHWVNQAGQAWCNQSSRAIISRPISDIIENSDACIEAYQRCVDTKAPVSMLHYIIKRNGFSDQRCHIMIFPSEAGIGFSILRVESEPNETRAPTETLSAMGRMLAHEIKNPLAGISGAAQLLKEDVKTDEGRALIDLIKSEIGRISRLADRMERLGDMDKQNLQDVNIHEILRNSRKVIQSGISNNVVFTESYDPSLPSAKGDADALMQALLNLIKNAVESIERAHEADTQERKTGYQGEVRLITKFRSGVRRRQSSGAVQRDVNAHGKQLPIEISIIDNGPGIPENIRNEIFQPFVTNKPAGQGLGLALVSKIAQAHGGMVEVQSRPGQTMFSILLPVSDEENS